MAVEKNPALKKCPILNDLCQTDLCQWWIDLSGVATSPAGKAPGECAVKSLARNLKNLKEEGIKVSVLQSQGVLK